ncbi:MAG: peptidylprolyl isomerase [Clostridia bacterium]|nr:peptidylprolyl isomerase [Clostridia bacterium]
MLAVVLALALGLCAFTACSDDKEKVDSDNPAATQPQNDEPVEVETDPNAEHTKVKFDIEYDGKYIGSFTMELYPEYAPITVANFISLVEDGFYNGLIFHRIAEGYRGPFVAQGGDPKGNGTGGSTPIKGEFAANGVNNTLSHTRGVVSMARRGDSYDSGSCQFFICYNDSYIDALDGQYAAFGKVIEGMEVVDSFLEIERNSNDKPLEDIIIKSATIVK